MKWLIIIGLWIIASFVVAIVLGLIVGNGYPDIEDIEP